MTPPRTLEAARAAFVDEVLRREAEKAAPRRQMEAERRRATFHVVRP
ncbi:hypothetical protein LPJ38_09555 [Bradyrhizobium daqingense]|uniref:Uncharacterized protein n=1 Tax=Bradyrhizobium daqingense TaxID=993502 RepID=A0A562L492_9BRAD|nr:hypothetical protein [Bradyrhizobium daqingense]TWI02479.1 hypothetical protein IQ17_04092 [Bradyrhizobium daqingense]UFS90948.1 hypothetical protein LPJ38_09555 [Bradyrhizobium daqingense]